MLQINVIVFLLFVLSFQLLFIILFFILGYSSILWKVVDVDSNFFEAYSSLHDSQPKHYYDSKKFNEMYVKFSDTKINIGVLNFNVRSVTTNGDTLVSCLETLKLNFDIILIIETWQKVVLKSHTFSQLQFISLISSNLR